MEDDAFVVAVAGQNNKVVHGHWRRGCVEGDGDRSERGIEHGGISLGWVDAHIGCRAEFCLSFS